MRSSRWTRGAPRAVRCNGVLAKPFEPQLLIGRVKELLAATPRANPAQQEAAAADAAAAEEDADDTGPVPVAQAGQTFTQEDFSLDTTTLGAADSTNLMPAGDVSLDDYFDRLDAAFANLSGTPTGQLKAAISDEVDTSWAPPSSGSWSAADPQPFVAPVGGREPEGAPAGAEAAGPGGRTAATAAVTVADAFAALLEAEQQGAAAPGGAEPGSRPGGPNLLYGMPATANPTPVVTEALVDEIVHRLAERLGGQGLQDIIARLVSETAERLVREEIERLKAAARTE